MANPTYLFWHLAFALLLAALLYRLTFRNPAVFHLLTIVSAGVLPDLDHLLFWDPKYLSELFPRFLGEGLALTPRTDVYPFILHLWLWPLTLLAATFILRKRKLHTYLLATCAGWTLHLALDGVLVII